MKAELEMPPGFRFHPTDDELVSHYLIRKCASQQIAVPIIAEIDLYKFNPWELPDMALYGEKEWYFFSPRDRKYPNGSRPNRAAGTGYWKATGADKPIGKPKPLGIKKALVFYAGKAPKGVKTNWIMHEYRLANVDRSASKKKSNNLRLDDFVLCRIYNKKGTIEKYYPDRNETVSIQAPAKGHHSLAATSDSFPNSSCSDHLPSSDVTCDHKEVQSLPKWEEPPAGDFNDGGFLFNTTEWLQNDPFAPQSEYMEMQDPFQDMLMYFEKSF